MPLECVEVGEISIWVQSSGDLGKYLKLKGKGLNGLFCKPICLNDKNKGAKPMERSAGPCGTGRRKIKNIPESANKEGTSSGTSFLLIVGHGTMHYITSMRTHHYRTQRMPKRSH